MSTRTLLAIVTAATLGLSTPPARADDFAPWVAASCDPSAGRGLVRFGYADGEGVPFFAHLPRSLDGGLSSSAPGQPNEDEAACRYAPAKEIKVRIGIGHGGFNDSYSVWIDGVRVAHGTLDDRKGQTVPVAWIVGPEGARACVYKTGEDPYVVESSEAAGKLPIQCDSAPHPVKGQRDNIEYPADGHTPPRAGTVQLVEAHDRALCSRLMAGAHPPSLEAVADVYQQDAWQFLGDMEGVALSRLQVDAALRLPSVYKIGSGGDWVYLADRDYALLVPADASEAELRDFAANSARQDWRDVPQSARARGWHVISNQDLGFPIEDSSFEIGTNGDHFVVLVFDTRSDEQYGGMSTVLQVESDGSSRLLCRFGEVQKHF